MKEYHVGWIAGLDWKEEGLDGRETGSILPPLQAQLMLSRTHALRERPSETTRWWPLKRIARTSEGVA